MDQSNKLGRILIWCITIAAFLSIAGLLVDQITARKKAEDALSVTLHQAQIVPTTSGKVVREVVIERASSDQLRKLSDSVFSLRKDKALLVKEVTRLSISLQQATLKSPIQGNYTDSVGVTGDCVPVGKTFAYHSDSITMVGAVLQEGVRIDSLDIRDTLYSRDIIQRYGFLKLQRREMLQVHHSNSLFSTDSAQVFKVEVIPSWYYRVGKPAIAFGIGAAAVYFIVTTLKNSK